MTGGSQGGRWDDLARPPLRIEPLRRALVAPNGPLARLDLVERTGSTNDDLVSAAMAEPPAWPHLSVLVADHQAAGRGRLGRTWETPARSSLTFSVLLRPHPVPVARWSWVPLLAGLAVARTLRRVAGVDAGLKWPNDVLVEGRQGLRKVAGILAEVTTELPPALVIGMGLNVTTAQAELPVGTATSLALEGAATTDRDTLLRDVLRELTGTFERWGASGGDAAATGLAAQVREACVTLGRHVRVELPGRDAPLVGVAEGLADDGRLLVRTGDELVGVAAGDVVHLRDVAGPGTAP